VLYARPAGFRLQMHFGRTKSPENTSSGLMCLVLVSLFDSAEPLDATGGTLRFRGAPVKKTSVWYIII